MVELEQIFDYDKEIKDLKESEEREKQITKKFEYHIKRLGRLI